MPGRSQDPALPPSVERVAALDPELYRDLSADVGRLARAGLAMAWAQQRLPALVAAGSPAGALAVVVEQARTLTGAPSVWALAWKGDPSDGGVSFRSLVGAAADASVPGPTEVSNTVIAQVARDGTPIWTDDASADARFSAAESVTAYALRSVGCVPIGDSAVLYLQDPDAPGRFTVDHRFKLAALGRLAAPFLGAAPAAVPRAVEPLPGLVGGSPPMLELAETVRAFAPMPWPALILGESGTGKESVARAMHELSARAGEPFVPVLCGAIPHELAESALFGHERGAFTGADRMHQGYVERARRGTLFLDEVGELPPHLQVKLLRLLQEGTYERVGGERELPFRGRILAATHREIDDPATRDTFRHDLYHRLAACVIFTPPLRDRPTDIPALAHHLLRRLAAEVPGETRLSLSDEAVAELTRHTWRDNNVRELENTLKVAVALALARRLSSITPDLLRVSARRGTEPDAPFDGTDLKTATDRFQRRMVEASLAACDGNRTKAAEALGVSRQWLFRLLQKWQT